MNRIKKIIGSALLSASLVAGCIGAAPATALAADTQVDAATAQELINKVVSSVQTAADQGTVVTDINFSLESALLSALSPNTPAAMNSTVKVDKKSGVATVDVPNGDSTVTGNEDINAGTIYSYNTDLGRYEVKPIGAGDPSLSDLSNFDFGLNDYAEYSTYFTSDDVTINGKTYHTAGVTLDLPGDTAMEFFNGISKKFSGLQSSSSNLDTATSMIDPSTLSNVVINVKINYDDNFFLARMTLDFTLNLFGDIGVTASSDFSLTDETLSIPAGIVKNATIVAGYTAKASKLKLKSVLSGKSTIFTVSGITAATAKKLTVPASVKVFGKSYKVTQAVKNAFKKATKLKTLVVKNKALKKAIKKNKAKYGLKKSVKIK